MELDFYVACMEAEENSRLPKDSTQNNSHGQSQFTAHINGRSYAPFSLTWRSPFQGLTEIDVA